MRCIGDSKATCFYMAEPGDVFCETHASEADSATKKDLLFFCQQESSRLAEEADMKFFAAVEMA
jgi:hypothetical protein